MRCRVARSGVHRCVSQAFGGGGTFSRLTGRGGRQAGIIISVSTASFGLHAGGLYDRPPFLVIGTNLGIELRR